MKTTNAMIYCTKQTNGKLNFYVEVKGKVLYLFTQSFHVDVHSYYSKRRTLNEALDFSRGHYSRSMAKVMEKLPSYLRYVEQEEDLILLRKTAKKRAA